MTECWIVQRGMSTYLFRGTRDEAAAWADVVFWRATDLDAEALIVDAQPHHRAESRRCCRHEGQRR